jgi:2-dehydro-3-deoxygalactonokinase
MSRLLAIDWGSSMLRGALIDDSGVVIDERASERGMLHVAPGEFEAALEAEFGDWLDQPGTRCLMAGMVGSRQGWVEAPYVACPASVEDFVSQIRPIRAGGAGRDRDIAIVPGATCEHDGVPDVLRGEEIKLIGAIDLLGISSATMLSPGTHSKWATVENGRLVGFSTMMSGEFYDILRRHSILSRSLSEDDGALDGPAFDDGVRRALAGSSLLQTVFSVRCLDLFDRLSRAALPSYLSGLVIGEALRWAPLEHVRSVVVIGGPVLTERFARALSLRGIATQVLGEEAAWRGLWAIDRRREDTAFASYPK